jgi:hypothetical protein
MAPEPTQHEIDAARLLLERAGYTVLKVSITAPPWWAKCEWRDQPWST